MKQGMYRSLILICVLFIITAIPITGSAQVYLIDFDEPGAELLMLQAINTIRYQNDLPLIGVDDNLNRAARRHALDMTVRDYFDHFSPDGNGPCERTQREGVLDPVLENIGIIRTFGRDQSDVVESLMDNFMASPNHRVNILDPDVTHVGIGFCQDIDGRNHRIEGNEDPDLLYQGYGTIIVVQDFCRRDVTLLEPDPYSGTARPGEFVTMRFNFRDQPDEAFLRIMKKDDPAKWYDVPMNGMGGTFRARFAIDSEGDFTIGIFANSHDYGWFFGDRGRLDLNVSSN